MRIFKVLFFLLTSFYVLSSCQNKVIDKIPVSDFFLQTDKSTYRLSPDGKHVGYLQNLENDNRVVTLVDVTGESTQIVSQTDSLLGNVSNYFWTAPNEIVMSVRDPKDNLVHLYSYNLENKETNLLLQPGKNRLRFVTPVRKREGGILIGLNKRDSSVFDIYRFNLESKKLDLVAENPGNIIRWVQDLNGKLLVALAGDSIQETLLYRKTEKEPFQVVTQNTFYNVVHPIGFVKDKPHHIYTLSNVNRDKASLVELDLNTGEELVLFSHPEVDISTGGYATESGEMVYAYLINDHRERHFLNSDFAKSYQGLADKLPGFELRVIDEDFSSKRFVIHAFTDQNPGGIYFYDGQNDKLQRIVEINPSLNGKKLANMKPISYTARDGKVIKGFLTLPINASNKPLPVIVYPHNGPDERNFWGYQADVQLFANRGYAVFQINFRGSTGYGKEFRKAGFKEWGGKIQEDISDGVEWLIDQRIADRNRIGIFGSGFGGYSALHGAIYRSDLYKAAASYGGFTNLFTHIKEVPPFLKPYVQKYYLTIGNPETESERLREMSPVFHAEKIKIPVFIAQGGKDSRSAVNETNQLVSKIRKNNIPITYLLREEEGRFFRKEENKIQLYEDLVTFFDTHLKK